MRLGEILGLTWDKVYLNHDVPHIKLEANDTKDKEPRIIPLACSIKGNPFDFLNRIPKPIHDDHVFLYQGQDTRWIVKI